MLRSSFVAFASRTSPSSHILTTAMPKVVKPRKGKTAIIETPRPEFIFEGGLRKVLPYKQTYLAQVKQRWVNRTVPEIFASEMPRRCTQSMIVSQLVFLCSNDMN